MISKMNYLLLSTMMVAAIDSTFGRGCDCCKKLCADKDSNESFIKSENNKIVNEKPIKWNEYTAPTNMKTNTYNENLLKNIEDNDNSNFKQIIYNEKLGAKKVNEDKNVKTLYFRKIDKDDNDDNLKKCFNNKWYEACKNKVLLLEEVNKNDTGVLSVTGSDNKLVITGQGNVLENANCNPNNNKWIIVKVITLNKDLKSAEDSFIFYVDDINSVDSTGVFENIWCYSIKIIAANTSNMESMFSMFGSTTSALELDGKEDTGPGLIGLEKLNVENVNRIHWMFYNAIHKQATLDQLGKWRFSGKYKVSITKLFNSRAEGLNFKVLDGWNNNEDDGPVVFCISKSYSLENVFVQSGNGEDFTAPSWYGDIIKVG